MNYVEEKTPSGKTIKVLLNSWEYTVFDKNGSVVYADETKGKVLNKVLFIAFMSRNIIPVKDEDELVFYKVTNGEIIIPFKVNSSEKRNYLFIKTDEKIDVIPVRIITVNTIYKFVREIEKGVVFNYVITDDSVTENEEVILKNRCPSSIMINAEQIIKEAKPDQPDEQDVIDKNLNIMSNNPVFLARIHLKNLELSKVNQVLLDFDISSVEAQYMLRFIETMVKNPEKDEKIEKNKRILKAQADAFRFYIHLINKNENEIKKMITVINDNSKISLYSTLVAKVKILFTKQDDLLQLTEYENLLYEAKEKLQES